MDSAAPRPPHDAAQPAPAREPIYLNRDFRVLWLARTLGQTAANTAQFGSLIIIAGLLLLAYTWMYAQWGAADPRDLMRCRETGAQPT